MTIQSVKRVLPRLRAPIGRLQKRQTIWSAGASGTEFTVAGSSVVSVELQSQALLDGLGEGLTLVRTRGMVLVVSDQNAAAEFPSIWWGLIVQNARGATLATLPRPFDEPDAGWFAAGTTMAHQGAASSASSPTTELVDSRGMRKIRDNDVIVLSMQNVSTDGALMMFSFKFLYKLS